MDVLLIKMVCDGLGLMKKKLCGRVFVFAFR